VAGLPVSEEKPLEVLVRLYEEPRNLEQYAKLWAMLADLSEQVDWPVDGRMAKLTKEDWKDVMTAGLERDQRVTQGIEGGFVILGRHTSRMSKRTMAALIELMQHFGDSRGVVWSDPKLYRECVS
jgi:hypothetical protein